MADVDDAFLWPPPSVGAVHLKLRGAEGKAQFPVGLVWGPSSSPEAVGLGAACALLSWGHDDRETYVSALPLKVLLGEAMAWRML